MNTVPAILISAVLSFLLTGAATAYARRRNLFDHPGERHSHDTVTPRGGGAGLVASLLLTAIFLFRDFPQPVWSGCIAPGVLVLAIVGWWDDHRSLSARFRFLVQLAVSIYVITCAASTGWIQGAVPMILAGLFLVWMTNLYNFMDGSNGMAGLQGVFAGGLLAALFAAAGDPAFANLGLLLAAVCIGFLPWNLGRARVFMGDVGSLALGFAIAALLLYGVGSGAVSIPVSLLIMLVFLTDSTATLVVRVLRGEQWYNAHRKHLYQRLIAHGWSHGRVAMFYQVLNLALVLPAVVLGTVYPQLAWPLTLGLGTVFLLGWCLLNRKIGELAEAG